MTNYFPKLLITGANGQLGQALVKHPLASEFEITACKHHDLDICQPASIEHAINLHVPDIIINTAGFTSVDKAESEAAQADRVNHIGAGQLALACNKHQIKLIHLSTDYVFDGTKDSPYTESDDTNPINIYGKSKWQGEMAVRRACDNHLILRVSSIFSEYGHNFLRTILRLARERTVLNVVTDQVSCPTYAGDIAEALFKICKMPAHKGTYHFCSNQGVSWYDFAQAIIIEAQTHEKLSIQDIKPVTAQEYPTAAKRPPYSILDCQKIKSTFNLDQPSWQEVTKATVAKLIREKA